MLKLRDSCKKSFWDGSSSSPSPPTRSSWSTRLCIVTALRQSCSITSGIRLNNFSCATNTPCVHGRCSFCGLARVHFFAGPRSRTFPGASICHAVLFGFSSGTVNCPRHHRASYQCPSWWPNTRSYNDRRLQSNLSSLRCARAAAMRVDANEPTNLETAKALWAQQRSGKARPGRSAPM